MTNTLKVGDRGTTSGFPATIVRVCEWSRSRHTDEVLIEVRVPGGVSCISSYEFVPTEAVLGWRCPACRCVAASHVNGECPALLEG